MNILNINAYFLSSTVHDNLQSGICKDENIKIDTFVPLSGNYEVRPECKKNYGENINIKQCFNKLDRFFFKFKNKKIFNELCNSYNLKRFDLIHAHSLFTNGLIAKKVNEKYKIPYIVTIRDTDVNIFFKYMIHLRKLGIDIMLNADKIVFLSSPYYTKVMHKYVPKKYKKIIENKSVIIPNPIDDYWFKNIYKKQHCLNNPVNLLYVGSIEKRKNLIKVANAIKNLNNKGYNFNFTIVGSSKDFKILRKLKKYRFVKYINQLSKEELLHIYRSSDIFIMASIRESFGLVYAEAMTQGLPVIYTKDQGFDGNFLNGQVGYAVDAQSIESIEKGIVETLFNYERIVTNIWENSYEFKIDNIVKKYIELFYIQ